MKSDFYSSMAKIWKDTFVKAFLPLETFHLPKGCYKFQMLTSVITLSLSFSKRVLDFSILSERIPLLLSSQKNTRLSVISFQNPLGRYSPFERNLFFKSRGMYFRKKYFFSP